jgi:hypothetical protein
VSSSDHSSAAVVAAATAQAAPVISRTPIVWDVSPAATQHHQQPAASTSPQRPVVRSLVRVPFFCSVHSRGSVSAFLRDDNIDVFLFRAMDPDSKNPNPRFLIFFLFFGQKLQFTYL